MEKRRIALKIEYNGRGYAGWQRQKNACSVQEVLEGSLSKLCASPIQLTGASRTDAGVHARGQIAHFDTTCRIPGDRFAYALNTFLPDDIRVQASWEAKEDFHARFDAKGKIYTYSFLNAAHSSALLYPTIWHIPGHLQIEKMQKSLPALCGRHDYAAFMAAGNQSKTSVRTIYQAQLTQRQNLLTLTLYGDGFLYNMVRIIAGTLLYVGLEKEDETVFERAIASLSRLTLGPTAPPQGLCLEKIYYKSLPWQETGYFEKG